MDPEVMKNFGGNGKMDGDNIEKMFENMREKQGLSKEQWDAQFADMATKFDTKDAKKFDSVKTDEETATLDGETATLDGENVTSDPTTDATSETVRFLFKKKTKKI
jgi:hypothetical protein